MLDWLIAKGNARWERIKFLWEHDHYFICTDERPKRMPASERWYWHIEKCWCGARQTVLTNWCDGHTQKS
jgi:hypothetical protein